MSRLMPWIEKIGSELREDISAAKTVPALSAGFTSGLGLLVSHIAFGTFIFSGPLAPYASQGVGLVLFGSFAACLIIALAGGYRGAISGLSPLLVVVMALIGGRHRCRRPYAVRYHDSRAGYQRGDYRRIIFPDRAFSALQPDALCPLSHGGRFRGRYRGGRLPGRNVPYGR